MSLTLRSLPAVAIQQSALSPQTWPFSVTWLPEHAYLVGGSVRDALLHRQADYLDLDFVLPERAIETAQHIAQHYGAGFVVLDAEHQIARVVFAKATVDFAQQIGPTIAADLKRRDFTINAIAYNPHGEILVDPLNGYADLQRRRLCMIAPENLEEDPLRLLRAYRQAAQLEFSLDVATQDTIRRLAPHLDRMAAERVRGELDCLLSLATGSHFLRIAWQDGLLHHWLPAVTEDHLQRLVLLDSTMAHLYQEWPDYAHLLAGWVRETPTPGLHRSWLKATKLSQLLADPLPQAEQTLTQLKYSRVEQQAVLSILKGWHYLHNHGADLGCQSAIDPSLRLQYELFKLAGAGFPGVALLAWSHNLPTARVRDWLNRYLDPQDPLAHPRPLLSGRDLIQALGLKSGPQIGQLLEALQLAQVEGQIGSRSQALAWVQHQLEGD